MRKRKNFVCGNYVVMVRRSACFGFTSAVERKGGMAETIGESETDWRKFVANIHRSPLLLFPRKLPPSVGWAAKTGRSVALSSSYKILGFPTRFHHRRCSCNFLALHKREEAEEGRRRRRLSYTILMTGLQVCELSTLVEDPSKIVRKNLTKSVENET